MRNTYSGSLLFLLISLLFVFSCNRSVSLFNGKNLDGWTNYGTEQWYAQNGELICESGPDKEYGYLGTNKYYDNFILELDFNQVVICGPTALIFI